MLESYVATSLEQSSITSLYFFLLQLPGTNETELKAAIVRSKEAKCIPSSPLSA